MKSRKKLRKNSNRKKNKINRKTIRKPSRKIYKKFKYGGQFTSSISEDKKLELHHRIQIGTLINDLRKRVKNNESDRNLQKDILNLIHRVYVYKNIFATNLIFSNYNELYRERTYFVERAPREKKQDFFEKYKDLNKLLDRIESDFNLAADDFKKTYLTIKSEPSSQLYNDNIGDNIDDDNDLKKPLL